MKVYKVISTDDEYRSSCKAICDSVETALEFSKTLYDWYNPTSVYENLIEVHKRTGKYDWHIKAVDVLTLKDVKQTNTAHKDRKFCQEMLDNFQNDKNSKVYKAFKKRLLYLIENDI